MKKNATPVTVPPAPAVPVVPKKIRTPDPVLDHKTARPVTPRRHEKSGRTIGFHQPAGETGVHLFSPTGNFIETVPVADVAAFEPKPEPKPEAAAPAPAAEPPAADPAPVEAAPAAEPTPSA
jgi:hypothetical protein